jgi:hypothetical protein
VERGYGFLLRSEFFFRTTRELEYLFFCRAKCEFFFQNSTIGYMTKTRCCCPSVNAICGRIMIELSLSSVSKHNMWSYYDWVVVVFRQ